MHLVLFGDSIFDNGRYTGGGPDVAAQVRKCLPRGWRVSLLAVDGSTTDNIGDQVRRLPEAASHLVLSVGGNNILMQSSQLGMSLFGIGETSVQGGLHSLLDVAEDFEARYRAAVNACLQPGLPLVVCTIYNGCFPDKNYQRLAARILAVFNDVILRVAVENKLSVIDLRFICTEASDYANPIEPSSAGGEKIARVIAGLVTEPEVFSQATKVVGRM